MAEWQPQPSDYHRVFAEQNPWHSSGTVPTVLAPPAERSLAQVLWQRLLHNEPRRHQVVLGPRRVGKTTVLYQTVRHLIDNQIAPARIWWLRLDHPLLMELSLGEMAEALIANSGATAEEPLFLMLDEIIYAHKWDLWLKTFFDERWPLRIAATSSSTAALQGQRHESGVGRWEEQHLLPCGLLEALELVGTPVAFTVANTLAETLTNLSAGERADPTLEGLRRYLLLVGGFPELLTRPFNNSPSEPIDDLADHILESQQVLRSDAVERAVYKDIPQTAGVENPMMLERLLYVLAGQVTGILSPTNVGRELGIAQPTFDRYLSYLEQAYLVFTLTNYSASEAGVQRRGRKLHFVDGAVRNAALHRGTAPLNDPDEQGALLENLVAATVNTLAAHAGVRLHYWRDGNDEVDLVYDDPRQPLAFEIASSDSHSQRGLSALVKRHSRFRGHTYLVAPQASVIHPDPAGSGIGMLPLDTFLLAVGAQAHQAMLTRLGVSTNATDVTFGAGDGGLEIPERHSITRPASLD